MKNSMVEYKSPASNEELVKRWLKRAREAQLGHYAIVDKQSGKHVVLGVIIMLLTAVLGLSNVIEDVPKIYKVALGLLGAVASFISALQTFFKYEERANAHRLAAIEYGKVRRKLEVCIAASSAPDNLIDEVRVRLDELASSCPNIPEAYHIEVKERV